MASRGAHFRGQRRHDAGGHAFRSEPRIPACDLCHVVDRASIQEYILHSWSLVKMGTTAAQKKLFFNLRKLKGQMQAIDDGDLSPEHVTSIATRLNVSEMDVVQMNRRIGNPGYVAERPATGGRRRRVAGLAG